MQASTIRPGFMVALSTSITGNVRYRKETIDADHTTADGERKARWETERTIADPAEFEAATKIRGKVRTIIGGVCVNSAFCLLCPLTKESELDAAMAQARKLADDFNATATTTRVRVYVMTGRIAADDVEATKAINSEIRDLLDRMERGARNLDVKMIRDAANQARAVGTMVSPEASERLQKAIDVARSAARRMVKAGEQAAVEVDAATLRNITEARTAFLDLDDAKEIAAPAVTGRAVDLDLINAAESMRQEMVKRDLPALDFSNDEPVKAAPMAAAAPQMDLL